MLYQALSSRGQTEKYVKLFEPSKQFLFALGLTL